MKVRFYDKDTNTYYKSEVLAKINTGWYEKQLVCLSNNSNTYVKFIDYLDKSNENYPKPLIATITPDIPDEWIFCKTGTLDKTFEEYVDLIDMDTLFFEFIGYEWIFENTSLMIKLMAGASINIKESVFENNMPPSSNQIGWHYVETQEDAIMLLSQTSGFHDSVLKELSYVSGAYVNTDRSMYPTADIRKVTMLFQSQWCSDFELVFEGATGLNLRPAGDNYSADIYGASIYVKNASVFFCDGETTDFDKTYDGTWIVAYSLRWRFLDREL